MEAGTVNEDPMDVDASRSASPTPPPPIAATPGPRATALQRLYADATAHILKTCSYTSFASCFPTPARMRPESLRDLHAQFSTGLAKSMRANFDDILEERDVVRSLNELDQLVGDAKKRRAQHTEDVNAKLPTPPHTMPARELYVAHLAPSLAQLSKELTARQNELSNENTVLLEDVMQQRQHIKKLVGDIEDAVLDLERAAQCLGSEEVDKLRDENRSINDAMQA